MATANLSLSLPATEQDAQKVATYNEGINDFDSCLAGMLTLSVAGSSNVTLTRAQGLNRVYKFTGALTGNIVVSIPHTGGTAREFTVWNATSGAFTLTVKTTAGGSTGIAVAQGTKRMLFHDGTNVAESNSGVGAGDALTTQPLSQFAATTSAQLRGVLSDENGTGPALFDSPTSPTFLTGATISGAAPSFSLTDTTGAAKSLTIAVDADFAQFRESAGAAGSLLVLDLLNNRVGLGVAAPGFLLDGGVNTDALTSYRLYNPNAGSAAQAVITSKSDVAQIQFTGHSSARVVTRYGTALGGFSEVGVVSGEGLMIGTITLAKPIIFGTNGAERMRIDSLGSVIVSAAALATTATDGFLYIPTCAGTPTGVPTAYAGRAPMILDTAGVKLWLYTGGAWKGVVIA